MKKIMTPLIFFLTIGLFTQCKEKTAVVPVVVTTKSDSTIAKPTSIFPGKGWTDTQGRVINAHSGGIVYENGFYYWFGTYKLEANENTGLTSGGISCYKSSNLINWEDMGIVMPLDNANPNSDISVGTRVERSKIVYNALTKRYIAYFTIFPKGTGLTIGYTGVAISSSITGPYIYLGKFLASSTAGTGDFAFHKEPNGDLYHIAVRKTDRALVIVKMTDDYLKPSTDYAVCPNVAISTEAPAIILRNGVYHLIGSGSAGWDPTAPRYYTATSLKGPWTVQANPLSGINPLNGLGASKTFGGQSTFFIQIEGADNRYVAMFDEWRPTLATTSGYIWLPFKINSSNLISISWIDSWNMSWF
jgi:hypothetical protein